MCDGKQTLNCPFTYAQACECPCECPDPEVSPSSCSAGLTARGQARYRLVDAGA